MQSKLPGDNSHREYTAIELMEKRKNSGNNQAKSYFNVRLKVATLKRQNLVH